MLKKSKRLNRAVFDEVFKHGINIPRPLFLIKKMTTKGNSPSFAVSVSKKQAPKASERNRIRRKMYRALEDLSQKPLGILVICLPKKQILDIPLSILKEEIEKVLLSK